MRTRAQTEVTLLLLVLVVAGPVDEVRCGEPDEKANVSREALERRARDQETAGDLEAAIRTLGELVALDRRELLAGDKKRLPALERLARLQRKSANFAAAHATRAEMLEVVRSAFGPDDWRVRSLLAAQAHLEVVRELTSAQLKELDRAEALTGEARSLRRANNRAEAVAAARQVLEIRRRLLGDGDLETVGGMELLGDSLKSLRRYSEALDSYESALNIRLRVLGEFHPSTVTTLTAVGHTASWAGDLKRAESCLNRAVYVCDRVMGKDHEWNALNLLALARVLRRQSKFEEAEPVIRRALELRKRIDGPGSLRVADCMVELGRLMFGENRCEDASNWYRAALKIREEKLGPSHFSVAELMNREARLRLEAGDYKRAEELARRGLVVLESALPADHSSIRSALLLVGDVLAARGVYGEAEQFFLRYNSICGELGGADDPNIAFGLRRIADAAREQGQFERAREAIQRALEITERASGREATAWFHRKLGWLAMQLSRYAEAHRHLGTALTIQEEATGKDSGATVPFMRALGDLYREMGDYPRSDRLLRRALEVATDKLGPNSSATGDCCNDLAVLREAEADYVGAEELYRRVLGILGERVANDHPNAMTTLENLALIHILIGEYEKAERTLRRVLKVRRAQLSPEHPEIAQTLMDLGALHIRTGRNEEAFAEFTEALAVVRGVFGDTHMRVGIATMNLGLLHMLAGEYALAESRLRESVALWERLGGIDHPRTIECRCLLGDSLLRAGRAEAAAPVLEAALAASRVVLAAHHPLTANCLHQVALLRTATGDVEGALPLFVSALEIQRRNLELSSIIQSERAQFEAAHAMRRTLDDYLDIVRSARQSADDAYAHVLAWKGAAFAREFRLRRLRGEAAVSGHFAELDTATRRLATLSLRPRTELGQEQIERLTQDKERLERELAKRSRAYQEWRASVRMDPAGVRKLMPPGTALVDYVEYSPGISSERRLLAFVLRRDEKIACVDLGPVEPVERALHTWRRTFGAGEGDTLRRLVWEPIAVHLKDCTTVLISPDGVLGDLAFPALPGSESGRFLIEEKAIAVIAVPQMLPALLSSPAKTDNRSLLLVGDVDYGPLRKEASASGPGGFKPLPGTRDEIAAIRKTYESTAGNRVTVLRGTDASEANVRASAPKHAWLHVATHGYFAARSSNTAGPSRGSVVAPTRHPGLNAGIALAAVNTPAAEGDDGVLTALEVAAVDLSGVEVAVLSACETGRGEQVSGEGVLGLQRAFQVAGARTTITSLWKVPDEATSTLMQRVYKNLWTKKMGRLEALREAQIWMLNNGKTSGGETGRGLTLEEAEDVPAGNRLPPRYWAAFVLSGDWR